MRYDIHPEALLDGVKESRAKNWETCKFKTVITSPLKGLRIDCPVMLQTYIHNHSLRPERQMALCLKLCISTTGLSTPRPVMYCCPFQGGASIVVYPDCQCSSAFCMSSDSLVSSVGKELFSWLCFRLCCFTLCRLNCMYPFPVWCQIQFYRLLIIAFSSTFPMTPYILCTARWRSSRYYEDMQAHFSFPFCPAIYKRKISII